MKMFDENCLRQRVEVLGRFGKTAFAASCAEWLWPLAERYTEVAELFERRLEELRAALDSVWSCVFGNDEDLRSVQALAESMVPVEDDSWVFVTGYGQNAIAAVAYAARTWLTDQSQEAIWAAYQLYEAANYAAQKEVPDTAEFSIDVEDRLIESPVVQAVGFGDGSFGLVILNSQAGWLDQTVYRLPNGQGAAFTADGTFVGLR